MVHSAMVALFLSALAVVLVESQAKTLVWSDDFNGAAGGSPDPRKWTYDIGGGGWGNNELEYYTNSRVNSALDGAGHLKITATTQNAANFQCWYGKCSHTSARLLTKGLFSTMYGRIEARIKIPHGKGFWPAFWTLGNNIDTVSWPQCGEIDVMEVHGSNPTTVSGTIHGLGYSGAQGLSGSYSLPGGGSLSNDFHVYAIDWTSNGISWSLDNHVYFTRTPANVPPGTSWAFNGHNFFLILNLAVGGNFDGNPNNDTQFPQSMLVDYVRVYSM